MWVTLISDIINVLINTMVFLEDDDMYVRLLRLFSLNESSSSSLRKKSFSVDHSDNGRFSSPYEDDRRRGASQYSSWGGHDEFLALLGSIPVFQESILTWDTFSPQVCIFILDNGGEIHPTLSVGSIPSNVLTFGGFFPWNVIYFTVFGGMGWAWAQWVSYLTVMTHHEPQSVWGGWRVISSWELSEGRFLATELWTTCSNWGMQSPESRDRKMSLRTAVRLLSLRKSWGRMFRLGSGCCPCYVYSHSSWEAM